MTHRETTHRGPGLARGPALIIGAILSAFGLILFLKTGDTSTDAFPDGSASGPTFLGFETNGWTAWFTTCAGALLLFGAAEHLLAKTISLLVGLALGACAVLGFVDGDVLGLAAANFWTSLGWAIAAGLLLLNVFAPRVDRHERYDDGTERTRRGWGRRRRTVARDDEGVVDERSPRRAPADDRTVVDREREPATGPPATGGEPRA